MNIYRREGYVPLMIRDRSAVVTWLWCHPRLAPWLRYDRARRLARWLP